MKRHPWHPALVHFPIAGWVLATLLDIGHLVGLDTRIGSADWSAAANVVLWAGLIAVVPTIAAGLLDFAALPRGVQDAPELSWHIAFMTAALVLFLSAAIWRARIGVFTAPLGWYVTAVEVAGSIALIAGGHCASVVVFRRLPAAGV
jgi:uncharacterized membrane protein